MKFKWVFPFIPTLNFALPIPADVYLRYLGVIATLVLVATLLVIVQPWREDAR